MLRIHFFGSLRLFHDEQPLKFSALPKTLPLLAHLLLQRNAPTARDHLAFTLWPDGAEADARSNLRRHLHDLRRALPPAPDDQPWLLADSSTVQWNPAAAWRLDVAEFEQLRGDSARLAEAVALYTGDLLPNCYEDWVIRQRERLRTVFFEALLQLVEQRRSQGDYAQAIAYAQQMLQHDPLHEEAVCQLMRLRHASGDRAGALQEYARFTQRLSQELASDPLPATQALYKTITHDQTVTEEKRASFPPAVMPQPLTPATSQPPPGPPNNLLAQLTPFIGREAELAALQQMLLAPGSSIRLLTLIGPGGSGKTRLAAELAARLYAERGAEFADGIFMVWLATVSRPDLVIPTIANALNLGETPGTPPREGLKAYLRNRRLLLVLDNFEHLTAAAPDLLALLSIAPDLRIVVTSRARLQLYGEHEFAVPPLPLPPVSDELWSEELSHFPSVALFVARSRAVNPSFALTQQNAATIAEICTRLDGLPLAIELAAARSKLLSPSLILTRLENALTFLTERSALRPRNQPEWHQTLQATLDWSFHLLNASDQRLLARLAVFSGNFSLEAVEAICDLEARGTALDGLETLVNNSLLRQFEVDGEINFRMLTIIREYALNLLAASPEAAQIRERHARYFLTFATKLAPHLHGTAQQFWLNQLESAHANLRAALTWSVETKCPEIALPLATTLQTFWVRGGHLSEGRQWLEQVLALPTAHASPGARAAALNAAAWLTYLYYSDTNHALPIALYEESLALSRATDDHPVLAQALLGLANMRLFSRETERALPLLEESLALYQTLGDALGQAGALAGLAIATAHQHDYAQAQRLTAESVALYSAQGDQWNVGYTILTVALELYHTSHERSLARQLLVQCLPVAEAADDRITAGRALVNLADLALVEADYARAEGYARKALTLLEALGEKYQPPRLIRMLGIVAARRGDYGAAVDLFLRGINLNRALGDQRGIIACLVALAYVASQQGQVGVAVRQLAAAKAALDALGRELLPADLHVYQDALTITQTALSPEEFTQLWMSGQTSALDEAIGLII